MEKRKLLLVAISVGIFLALTIGAALLVFTPKNVSAASLAAANRIETIDTGIALPQVSSVPPAASSSTAADKQQLVPLDPVDMVRRSGDVPGLQTPPEGSSRGNEFHVSGSGQGSQTLISVPKPSTAAVPDTAPAGKAVSQAPASPRPVAAPATPASAQTQPKPAAQTKTYNDYWVQTGAFSTVARAEGAKANLASKGITSIIENRELDGKTFFRVRVGPYTSQNEANYWLSLIKSIDGFEESQVRQTTR